MQGWTADGLHALRARLIADVSGLDPVDDREARSIEEILHGLRTLPQPLDVDADPTHVTGSAIVLSDRGVVLLKHKRLGIWLQPGGHVAPGEDPAAAAVREATEETGLVVGHPPSGPTLVHVDAHDGGRGHRHLDLRYLVHAAPDDPDPPPEESQEVAWFGWDAAIDRADMGLRASLVGLRSVSHHPITLNCCVTHVTVGHGRGGCSPSC